MPRLSYDALQKQIAKLQTRAKALESAQSAKKTKAVAQVRALMKKLGVQVSDLAAAPTTKRAATDKRGAKAPAKSAARKPVAAKYRDPATGTTWSGRGRTPVWLSDQIAQGRSKEEFAIDAAPVASA